MRQTQSNDEKAADGNFICVDSNVANLLLETNKLLATHSIYGSMAEKRKQYCMLITPTSTSTKWFYGDVFDGQTGLAC